MMSLIIRENNQGTYDVLQQEPEGYNDPIITGASLHYALDVARATFQGEELNNYQF